MATTSPSFSDDKKSDPSYTAGLTVSSSLNDEVIGQETLQSSAKVEYSDIYLRARRKMDLRILPLVLIQYIIMRIDVQNITNAAILNLEERTNIKSQLHLSAQQWVWVISSFYYPYMFLEPVSTVLLKLTSAPIWLSRIMITWGIITCCMAAVTNYGSLIACRVLIGAAEAGYFPCYYWSFWYTPAELSIRIAIFYSGAALSGFFGGFLAYAISYTNGVLAGWQWLFIIEGIPPTILGVLTYFFLPSYPEETKWLSQEERDTIVNHLHKDSPKKSGKTWDKKAAILLLCDPTFWTFTFAWICVGVGGHGISYSLPSVIHSLGFTDSKMSNVLTMPPAFAYFTFSLLLGWWLQKGWISPFPASLVLDVVVIVCYVVLLKIDTARVRYGILIIATGAGSALYPVLWPSRVQAVRGTAMSGLAIGLHNASAQFSGILGPQVYSSVYAPTYHVSYKVSIALISAAFVFHSLTWYFMHGPIQKYTPFLAKHVQAQTQIRKGDLISKPVDSERIGHV